MSATAIRLLNHLRENGVEEGCAVKIAEEFGWRVDSAVRDAKARREFAIYRWLAIGVIALSAVATNAFVAALIAKLFFDV